MFVLAFDAEQLWRNGNTFQPLFHDAYSGGSVDDRSETMQENVVHT